MNPRIMEFCRDSKIVPLDWKCKPTHLVYIPSWSKHVFIFDPIISDEKHKTLMSKEIAAFTTEESKRQCMLYFDTELSFQYITKNYSIGVQKHGKRVIITSQFIKITFKQFRKHYPQFK